MRGPDARLAFWGGWHGEGARAEGWVAVVGSGVGGEDDDEMATRAAAAPCALGVCFHRDAEPPKARRGGMKMGEKETMSGDALRESPTRASQGRESSAPSVSEGVTAPRDVATGQSSGRMETIGSSGQDGVGVQDASAAPNLGSSGQERSSMSGAQSNPLYEDQGQTGTNPMHEAGRVAPADLDGLPDIDAAAAKLNWDLVKNKPL